MMFELSILYKTTTKNKKGTIKDLKIQPKENSHPFTNLQAQPKQFFKKVIIN